MTNEKQAVAALNQYGDEIAALQNVVGIGVVRLSDDNTEDGEMAVAVYVLKKLPREKLDEAQLIPRVLELNVKQKKILIKTKVIEQGEVELEQSMQPERL